MNEQDLKIADSVLIFFESLPDIIMDQVLENYFKKHQEKVVENTIHRYNLSLKSKFEDTPAFNLWQDRNEDSGITSE